VTHVPVVITVDGHLPPSLNRLMRMHWAKRVRLRNDFYMLMKALTRKEDARALKAWKELNLKVKIQMEVGTPKLYDEDNLNALAKWPLDYLVSSGLVRNDSPEWVQFEKPMQQLGEKYLTLRIEPAAEK
jgi:hypothetical protein